MIPAVLSGHSRAAVWTAARRPLFFTLALATTVSIAGTGAVTIRIVGPAMLYWMLVPLIELAALAAIVGRRWRRLPASAVVDAFFAGHVPWIIVLIVLALTIPVLRPDELWPVLNGFALVAVPVAIVWSARIDSRFFRDVIGDSRGRAIADAVLMRLVTWPLVFGLFAVPGMAPIVREIADAVAEVLK